jgi:hypothetical protein
MLRALAERVNKMCFGRCRFATVPGPISTCTFGQDIPLIFVWKYVFFRRIGFAQGAIAANRGVC